MIKQVIIFAGGKGERMMPLSSNKPKCLILYGKEDIEVVAGEAILIFKSHELESLK